MRIIGGSAKGRNLNTPQNNDIRPTSDKVRLSIFNALYSRGGCVDKNILDGFCGTGALGCEALSQGAAHCTFYDISKTSLDLAKSNVAMLDMSARANFILKDVSKVSERPLTLPPADIIFLDAPYRKNLIVPTIAQIIKSGWGHTDTIFVIECEKEFSLDNLSDLNTDCTFDKTYGDTRVMFLNVKAQSN